ncbi:chemotaxis protein CheC [Mesobacillus foraminis]|uniref:Chemotaxis protein CheC n=1 Tax=Mesobacillus foraminis TaxID=279826 RepID=A0A4R2BF49_9BACI|nr:chemotaxis protein CheC [Mesobacillus foraminis]TCN25597.1 chemotaxis protein CheC [Mesobacillus foraminis]
MLSINEISDLKLDILKEIGNIGAGHAATSLSALLNRKIDMRVPGARIVSFEEMMNLAGGAETVVASIFLRIEGDAPGSMFFILSIAQAERFVQQLLGDKSFTLAEPPYDELGVSAFKELGNILSGSYLTALSEFTKLSLYPSVPGVGIDMAGAIISYGLLEISQTSDFAIVIDTILKEEDTENNPAGDVKGHFFLLPDPESFEIIFQSLGVTSND